MSALPEVHNTRRTARRRAWESEGQRPALAWGTMLASSPSPPATRPAAPSGQPEHPWSSLVVATGLFSACWAALEGLDLFLARRPEAGFAGMNDLLTACAAIAAVVLGTVAMAQCRVATVRTRDLGVGVGFVLYGAVVLYAGQLYPVGSRATSPAVLGYFPAATMLVVLGLVGWSVASQWQPVVQWSKGRCAEAVMVLAALTAVLQFTPAIARALTVVSLPSPAVAGGAFGQLTLAGVWAVVAGLALRPTSAGSAGGRDMAVGIVALGLVQGRLALVFARDGTSLWVLGSHLFQLVGFAVAFVVVAAEFSERASSQQGELLSSVVAARTDDSRRLARRTIEAGHGHDIRSALFAIDGAALTLVDRFDDLKEDDRIALGRMVGAGVDRLRQLVEVRMEEIEDFGVDTVVRSVVHSERRLGRSVTTAIPAGLRGVGRATDLAVVLHTLIRSPHIRTGGGPVVVRGARRGAAVLVLVEAAGLAPDPLSVPADWSDDSLMAPFARLEPELLLATGETLDLYVAVRLMTEQMGDVWTATRPDGGVSFAIRLPAAPLANPLGTKLNEEAR